MKIGSCRGLRHLILFFCTVLFFQNCGKFQTERDLAGAAFDLSNVKLNECDPNALDCPAVTVSAVKDDESGGSSEDVCRFNGETYKVGDIVPAYRQSTVPFGSVCTPEIRVCTKLGLTGGAEYAECEVGGPAACLFNGKTIAHGDIIPSYKTSTVPVGQSCVPTVLACYNGKLAPDPKLTPFSECEPGVGKACKYNGGTLEHGEREILYTTPDVPYGETCKVARVTCNNGELSQKGEFYGSCKQREGRACSHGNEKIKHDTFITRFATDVVPFGEKCIPVKVHCYDSKLTNDLDVFKFKACKTADPENCEYVGGTLNHDKTETLFTASRVPFGQKCSDKKTSVKCYDGKFSKSGNFYGKCEEDKPRSCSGNGVSLAHDGKTTVFKKGYTPFPQKCANEKVEVSCYDGKFSLDSFSKECKDGAPAKCSANGLTLDHNGQDSVFRKSSVPFGQSCTNEKFTVTCNNGQFSTTNFTVKCTEEKPKQCSRNGLTLNHSDQRGVFRKSSVPFGQSCAGVKFTVSCNNGDFSDNNFVVKCDEDKPKSCSANGITVDHSGRRTVFRRAVVPFGQSCEPFEVSCSNGQFSTTNFAVNCKSDEPKSCVQGNIVWPHGKSVSGFTAPVVPHGHSCPTMKISCYNGNFSGNPATLLWNNCRQDYKGSRWVNIPWDPGAATKTHRQACSDVGLYPSMKYGGCASSRVRPQQGIDHERIHYTHGMPILNPDGGLGRKGIKLEKHIKLVNWLQTYPNKIKCVPDGNYFLETRPVATALDIVVAYLCTDNPAESAELPMTVVQPYVDPCYPNGCR